MDPSPPSYFFIEIVEFLKKSSAGEAAESEVGREAGARGVQGLRGHLWPAERRHPCLPLQVVLQPSQSFILTALPPRLLQRLCVKTCKRNTL